MHSDRSGEAAAAEYGSVQEWLKWALTYTNVYISSFWKKSQKILMYTFVYIKDRGLEREVMM